MKLAATWTLSERARHPHAIAFPFSLSHSVSLSLSLSGVFRSRIFQELSGKRNGNKHAHPRISLKLRVSIPDFNSLCSGITQLNVSLAREESSEKGFLNQRQDSPGCSHPLPPPTPMENSDHVANVTMETTAAENWETWGSWAP